jgi:hypothetical protein
MSVFVVRSMSGTYFVSSWKKGPNIASTPLPILRKSAATAPGATIMRRSRDATTSQMRRVLDLT